MAETAVATVTERGATRLDDRTSEASMEQRKEGGYSDATGGEVDPASRPRGVPGS